METWENPQKTGVRTKNLFQIFRIFEDCICPGATHSGQIDRELTEVSGSHLARILCQMHRPFAIVLTHHPQHQQCRTTSQTGQHQVKR